MSLFGVIGDPIHHSLSPLIHRGWMRDLGIDADYRGFHIEAGDLRGGLAELERLNVAGLNVTLPHKMKVMAFCTTLSPLATSLGAVNTLVRTDDGLWHGENTDFRGFLDALHDIRPEDDDRKKALVLGAGGAAQAVAHALASRGYQLVIANRTLARAETLVEALADGAASATDLSNLVELMDRADVVINTLSAGHSGFEWHFPGGEGKLFYDISYGDAARAALDAASDAGWRVSDGLSMLVGQAAVSFELWHGETPDRAKAMERCRAALEMAK